MEGGQGKKGGTDVDMPNGLIDVVCSWTISEFSDIATDNIVPLLLFQVADATGEETGCYQVEEAGRYDKEDLHGGRGTGPGIKLATAAN